LPPEVPIKPLPPTPEHPIFFPVYPDNTLPVPPEGLPPKPDQGLPPHPDQGLPKPPVRPDQGLPKPPDGAQPPLVIWGPNDPRPSLPIFIPIEPPVNVPGVPSHPIYIPVYPDNGLPGDQPGIDNTLPEVNAPWWKPYVPPPGAIVDTPEYPQPQGRRK
jgi:hypothetical protein